MKLVNGVSENCVTMLADQEFVCGQDYDYVRHLFEKLVVLKITGHKLILKCK